MLNNFYCSHSAPSIQREALAPAWNSIWVDSFSDPHSAPGIRLDGEKWMNNNKDRTLEG